jgi:hypothetical protein
MASLKGRRALGLRCVVGSIAATHREFEVAAHRYRTHVFRRFQDRRRVRQAMIKTMDTYSDSGPTTLLRG